MKRDKLTANEKRMNFPQKRLKGLNNTRGQTDKQFPVLSMVLAATIHALVFSSANMKVVKEHSYININDT